jgi:hypothetical protein
MEWHCTSFWDHALNNSQILRSQKTKNILDTAIAVPIWLKKEPDEYRSLGEKIFSQ